MNPTRLVLASRNPHKLRELRTLLSPLRVELLSLADFPGAAEVEETGRTFAENALLKAGYAARHAGLPALADDSGLEVEALGGEPGVRSARFAGPDADDEANNRLLLARLADVPRERRRARFVCVIALAIPDRGTETFRGETTGLILVRPRGRNGFGYDPLFLSDDLGRTFAEVSPEEKNRVSHRARALGKLAAFLKRTRVPGR